MITASLNWDAAVLLRNPLLQLGLMTLATLLMAAAHPGAFGG